MSDSGVYEIVNLVNGKRYVGSAISIQQRWALHRSDLNLNRHGNSHLQNSWNKYGEDNFEFNVLEYCEIDKLVEREQFYIDEGTNYNISPTARSQLGYKHTEITKMVVGEMSKAMWSNPEKREKLIKAQTASFNRPEVKEKAIARLKEAMSNPEIKAKHLTNIKENAKDPAWRANIGAKNKVHWENNKEQNLANLEKARTKVGRCPLTGRLISLKKPQ